MNTVPSWILRSIAENNRCAEVNAEIIRAADSARTMVAPAGAADVDGWDDALSTGPMQTLWDHWYSRGVSDQRTMDDLEWRS